MCFIFKMNFSMEEIYNIDYDVDIIDVFIYCCERNGEICFCGNRFFLGLWWVFI